MKTTLRISLRFLLLGLATLALTAIAQVHRSGAAVTNIDGVQDAKSVAATISQLKGYTYTHRAEFAVMVKSLKAKSEVAWSEMTGNYKEMLATPERRLVMQDLATAHKDFQEKLDALGTVEQVTWHSTKSNVIESWERLQGAFQKAQTLRD